MGNFAMPLFFNKEPEMSSRRPQKDKDYVAFGCHAGFSVDDSIWKYPDAENWQTHSARATGTNVEG